MQLSEPRYFRSGRYCFDQTSYNKHNSYQCDYVLLIKCKDKSNWTIKKAGTNAILKIYIITWTYAYTKSNGRHAILNYSTLTTTECWVKDVCFIFIKKIKLLWHRLLRFTQLQTLYDFFSYKYDCGICIWLNPLSYIIFLFPNVVICSWKLIVLCAQYSHSKPQPDLTVTARREYSNRLCQQNRERKVK